MKSPVESPLVAAAGLGAGCSSRTSEELFHHRELLLGFAGKYIWWLSPEEMMDYPQRVVVQVMTIGVFADVIRLSAALSDDCLRDVVQQAEAGQFNDRSWHYWHYRLGLAKPNQVPPLPVRRIPQP